MAHSLSIKSVGRRTDRPHNLVQVSQVQFSEEKNTYPKFPHHFFIIMIAGQSSQLAPVSHQFNSTSWGQEKVVYIGTADR